MGVNRETGHLEIFIIFSQTFSVSSSSISKTKTIIIIIIIIMIIVVHQVLFDKKKYDQKICDCFILGGSIEPPEPLLDLPQVRPTEIDY